MNVGGVEQTDSGGSSIPHASEATHPPTLGSGAATVLVFCVVLFAMFQVESFPPAARVLPRIVGYPLLIACALDLGRTVWKLTRARRSSNLDNASRPEAELAGVTGDETPRAELIAFAWFAGYVLGVFILGFTLASIAFLVIYLRYGHGERFIVVVPVTVGMVGAIYFLFQRVAGVQLYEGYIGSMLGL
jgi:hypothetical protein